MRNRPFDQEIVIDAFAVCFPTEATGWRSTTITTPEFSGSTTGTRTTTTGTTSVQSVASGVEAPFPGMFLEPVLNAVKVISDLYASAQHQVFLAQDGSHSIFIM